MRDVTHANLGELLVCENVITREELARAEATSRHSNQPLATVLLDGALVSEEKLAEIVAQALDLEIFDPDTTKPEAGALLAVLQTDAERLGLLPLKIESEGDEPRLDIAMIDPLDQQALAVIEDQTGYRTHPVVARRSALLSNIEHAYRSVATQVMRPMPDSATASAQVAPGLRRRRDHGQTQPVPLNQQFNQQSAEALQRVDALVALLVRKGLISKEEYESHLRTSIQATEP